MSASVNNNNNSINLSLLPNDILTTIGRYVAKDPKDLAQLGTACKKTNQIVNGPVFAELFEICKYTASKHLVALRGPTGFDGLIHVAYQKTQITENTRQQTSKQSLEKYYSLNQNERNALLKKTSFFSVHSWPSPSNEGTIYKIELNLISPDNNQELLQVLHQAITNDNNAQQEFIKFNQELYDLAPEYKTGSPRENTWQKQREEKIQAEIAEIQKGLT